MNSNEIELVFSHKLFNPLFWHIRHYMHEENIRYIFCRGGSSSGKSVSTVQAALLSVFNGEGSVIVFRKIGSSIKNSIYEEFKVQARKLCIYDYFTFTENKASRYNGCKIDFSGIDDPEKIKGITNYRWVILEEVSEFEYADFKQITFRLRGKAGLQIIALFNPISEEHWTKKSIIDVQKWNELSNNLNGKVKNPVNGEILPKEYSEIKSVRTNSPKQIFNERTNNYELYPPDTVELLSTYKNNFWVVGSPDGKYGYYDKQTIANYEWYRINSYNDYRIYALGQWGSIKTGGEFFHSFDAGKHKGNFPYIPGLPIHLSIDDNVLPYISVSVWQYIKKEDAISLRQVHEICAEDPLNTVTKAAELVVSWLESISYNDVVFLYGDSSTKKGNTIDEEKRSFKDKFKEGLEKRYTVEERIPKSNPSVAMTGEFVNTILAGGLKGFTIEIDKDCGKSLYDYENVKKDANGAILKRRIKDKITQQTYEQIGHLSDTLRYFVAEVLKEEYIKFSLSRKYNKNQHGDIKLYDPAKVKFTGNYLVEINPSVNNKFVGVKAFYDKENSKVYVNEILIEDNFPPLDKIVGFTKDSDIQVEASKEMLFYLRILRENIKGIFARPDKPDKVSRINVHLSYIHNNFLFADSPDLNLAIDNILEYNGKDNLEVMNGLACIAERIKIKK